jgi:hypothetical protein
MTLIVAHPAVFAMPYHKKQLNVTVRIAELGRRCDMRGESAIAADRSHIRGKVANMTGRRINPREWMW